MGRGEVGRSAGELGRRRPRADLAARMCIHLRNAPHLALAICNSQEAPPDESLAGQLLHELLLVEQERLVGESCRAFGHGSDCRAALPDGTLEECLA